MTMPSFRPDRLSLREQVFAIVARGPISGTILAKRLGHRASHRVQELKRDGLIELVDGEWTLTESGRAFRRAKQSVPMAESVCSHGQ